MFSKIPALKLAEKAVAATVVCGALALGTGGTVCEVLRRAGNAHCECRRGRRRAPGAGHPAAGPGHPRRLAGAVRTLIRQARGQVGALGRVPGQG